MTGLLSLWWVWLAVALALGLAEVMLPGFIFLGFALGALLMALVVAIFTTLSPPALLAVFAGLSLLAWIGLRLAFKRQSSGARIVTRDINDTK
jgi:membrane protein implicated in regulation of membrane protease activity